MRRFLLAPVLVALAVCLPAQEKPVENPPGDGYDLFYLSEAGPIRLRLEVELDGKSLRQIHESANREYVQRLFKYLDRDGNGHLSEAEARLAPPPLALLPEGDAGSVFVAFNFAALDADGDGKVTLAEFVEYHRDLAGDACEIQFEPAFPGRPSDRNDYLFLWVDTNSDGKLSREEIKAAAKTILKGDTNDDERIDPFELLPAQPPNQPPPIVAAPPRDERPEWLRRDTGTTPAELARALLRRYGQPGLDSLSREQLRLPVEQFNRLDLNKNGSLDAQELQAVWNQPVDLVVRVRLGKREKNTPLVEVTHPRGKGVGRPSPSAVIWRQGLAGLELQVSPGTLAARFHEEVRERHRREFITADENGDGKLTAREAQRSPFFAQVFPLLDHNGDGILTEKELKFWLDELAPHQATAMATRASLLISQPIEGLWDVLDRNRDGILSIREIRAAPAVLAGLDLDGDGAVTPQEIGRGFRLALGLGQASFRRPAGDVLLVLDEAGRISFPPPTMGGGPTWFRKMDRNGDGEVSPREFLGPIEAFEKLDLDGDGLITLEEAMKAEATRKKE